MDTRAAEKRIADGFNAAGAQLETRSIDLADLERHIRDASGTDVDVIIAGGGDGTLMAIANAVVKHTDKAFGVLPLGTFNLFAKELNIPLDLDQAIASLARGRIEELPVAELNGQIFLNFSAIGLHPSVVCERDREKSKNRRWKMWATMTAFFRAVARVRTHAVQLTAPGQTVNANASSIIVCNNAYQLKKFGVEAVSVPERGMLNIYVATARKPLHNIWLMLRAFCRLIDHTTPSFLPMALPEIRVDSRRPRPMQVSMDGELLQLHPPLVYRIHEKPLRVLVPAKDEAR
jgi:diacylglycerol kinase family enzyme